MKKNILFIAIGLLSSIGLRAQNMVVTLDNATTETFAVASIQSIKFGDSTMILKEINGTVTTWDITDIDNYDFSSGVGLNDQVIVENSSLHLFPNPSSDLVNIQFFSAHEGNITIDIIDVEGKLIQQVYQGAHHEQQTHQWVSNAVKGTFYCRITTAYKTITKPIIIQ